MAKYKTRRELFKELGALGLLAGTLRESIARADAGATGIRRLIFYYLPGGVHPPAWKPSVPAATDVAIDAPKYGQLDKGTNRWRHALDVFDEPRYAALKADMMLVDGVDMRSTARPDIHINGIWAGLRGRPSSIVDPAEPGLFPRYSMDRLIGDGWDRQGRGDAFLVSQCTNVLVSELGQQANVGSHSEGYTSRVVRSSGEAWDVFLGGVFGARGNVAPDNTAEIQQLRTEASRWELSASRAKLKAMLPAADADKLDQVIAAFRTKQDEARRRLIRLQQPSVPTAGVSALPPRPPGADPDPSRFMLEKSDLLAKVMAPALALNRTQVVVWQTCGSNNDEGYWYDDGETPNFHNSIAHGGGYKGVVTRATWDVYRIEMQMLGNLLLELKSIPEGNGTVLDNTLVVTYSDMSNGGHQFKIPAFTLLAGGRNGRLGGGRLKLGKYVKLPAVRGNNDLLLTVAHMLGVTNGPDKLGKLVEMSSFGTLPHNGGLIRELFA